MKKIDLFFSVITALVILIVFSSSFISGGFLIDDPSLVDVSFNFMPLSHWTGQSYQNGEFPLWNPHVLFGMPLLGQSHCGGMYPVNALLMGCLSFLWAGSLNILLHSVLSGILFYFIMRQRETIPAISSAASIVFILSGAYFASIYVMFMMGSVCAFLFMILCFQSFYIRPRFITFVCGAFAVAWCCVSGDVELLTYGLLTLYLILFFKPDISYPDRLRRLFLVSLSVACGVLAMSVSALPTLETVQNSIRGPIMPYSLKIITMGENAYYAVPTFLQPFKYYADIFGEGAFNSGLSTLYQGFATLGLVFWGIAASIRNKEYRPYSFTIISILVFSFVRHWGPTAPIIELIPVLGDLHVTYKPVFFIHIINVILGFKVLSDTIKNPSKIGGAVIGVIMLIFGALMVFAWPWSLGGLERPVIGYLSIIAGVAVIAGMKWKQIISVRFSAYLLVLFIVIEVFLLAFRYVPRTKPEKFLLDGGFEKYSKEQKAQTRFVVFEELLSNVPDAPSPVFGLFEISSGSGNIAGPSRVLPARVFLYLNQIYNSLIYEDPSGIKYLSNWSITNSGTLERGRMHLLNLAGTQVIITRKMGMPYSSPYSFFRQYSANWMSGGTQLKRFEGSDYAQMFSPSYIQSSIPGIPGDRLKLRGQSKKDTWLSFTTNSGDENEHLLFSRFCEDGMTVEKFMDMKDFSGKSSLLQIHLTSIYQNASFVIETLEIINDKRAFQKTGEWGDVETFKNIHALPRAFISGNPVVTGGIKESIDLMSDPLKFIPPRDVIFEQMSPQINIVKKSNSGGGTVKILHYGQHKVELAVSFQNPSFLVLTDTYFPGWKAYVYERGSWIERKIFPADLAFRAVFLDRNIQRVKFIYKPVSFETGLWVTLTTLCFMLFMSMVFFS